MQTLFTATWWFGRYAVERAWQSWQTSKSSDPHLRLMDAVVIGTTAVELNPEVLSVGYGGLPNREGEIQLDAGIMEGASLRAGAVAGVRGIVPVIELARRVMEQTPHLMLVGEDAERFALQHGFSRRNLHTAESLRRWQEWYTQQVAPQDVSQERAEETADVRVSREWHSRVSQSHDTVGVIGWHQGHLVVACSTSGLAWKLPGRVGDSPIIGAGYYADDQVGAVVCTGVGEEIWRFALAGRAIERMRLGDTAQEACQRVIREMLVRKPENAQLQCALIAVRADGDYGLGATQPDHFEAHFCVDGEFSVRKPSEA